MSEVQQWEYECWTTVIGFTDFKANLTLMGSQGWELTGTIKYLFIFVTYIFKRPLKP